MAAKETSDKKKGRVPKYKPVPSRLSQANVDDIDAIAKAENMTRSEVIRRAIEAFIFNYKTDQLDQRQVQLEKRMKTMESAMRTLLVKAIRLNGQVLYFTCLPWTQGFPKQRINDKGFKMLYEKSGAFAAQFLKSKTTGMSPEELEPNTELNK